MIAAWEREEPGNSLNYRMSLDLSDWRSAVISELERMLDEFPAAGHLVLRLEAA